MGLNTETFGRFFLKHRSSDVCISSRMALTYGLPVLLNHLSKLYVCSKLEYVKLSVAYDRLIVIYSKRLGGS